MTDTRKAIEQALGFLEYHGKYWSGIGAHPQEIRAALRSALAQQGEPDAIYHRDRNCWTINRMPAGDDINFYLAPSTPQPETRKVIEQMVGALENAVPTNWSNSSTDEHRNAIQAGQKWLEGSKHA